MTDRARRPLVAGNWKMFHGGPTACDLASAIAAQSDAINDCDVVLCPPFTAIAAVSHEVDGTRLEVGAQNVHVKEEGAFTGEVSGKMLVASGAKWVIVGHSERRQHCGETDAIVGDKALAALACGLAPIACVGELLSERDGGRTLEVVLRQLDALVPAVEKAPGTVAIAYEPVWAIGTGRTATPEQAEEVHAAIRKRLAERGAELAEKTRILYGGSVKPDNAEAIFAQPNVDGGLIGGASLDAAQFLAIVHAAARAWNRSRKLGPAECSPPSSPSSTSPRASSSSWWCSFSRAAPAVSARPSAARRRSRSSAAAARATCSRVSPRSSRRSSC